MSTATESKHTPGPWTFYPDRLNSSPQDDKLGGIVSTGEDEWVVAEILSDCDTPETALANARLIAAAPAMLEALETAYEGLCDMSESDFDNGADRPLRDKMLAAIRLAKGESHV